MKMKPFCFHKTEGANNHIKHGDTCLFARNPIGVTYYLPTAMFTSVIHDFIHWQTRCHIGTNLVANGPQEIRSLNGLRRHFVSNREMTLIVMDEGNSRRSLN